MMQIITFRSSAFLIIFLLLLFTAGACRSPERVTKDDVPYYQPEDFDVDRKNAEN